MAAHTAMTQGHDPNVRNTIEQSVGILHLVSPKEHGWNGVLRQRYTDFQVHEITKEGEVLHLHDYSSNSREFERKEAAKRAPASTLSKDPTTSENPRGETNAAPDQALGESSDVTEVIHDNSDGKQADAQNSEAKVDEVPDGSIASSDLAVLVKLLDQSTTDKLIALYNKIRDDPKAKPKSHGSVEFPQLDRAVRGPVHSEIRRIFSGRIDTETNSEGIIKAAASGSGKKQWGKRADHRNQQNRQNGGSVGSQVITGKYLHFTLYKENKDTMEAIGHISRMLNLKASFFGTAGTKDRRAVTVQRVSMRARDPKKLLFINEKIFGVKIGDFKYAQKDIYLGCHSGNEFVIVMKNCTFQNTENESFKRQLEIAQSTIDSALVKIISHGFINYYGTQRFGTFEIGTHILGMKILKGDFEGVIKDLLIFDPTIAQKDMSAPKSDGFIRYDDISRAKALATYEETGDANEACKSLPRRCNTELSILKHLGKQHNDFTGAVLSITRNMRNMYLHAYQSFVWNFVASKRWELFGASVVRGDLVFATTEDSAVLEPVDAEIDDEETIHLGGGNTNDDESQQRVHVLTADDVASGRYSIFDVILPNPGTNVVYPENEIGEYYAQFMSKEENGGLNPRDMHRRQREFSLSGAYRKFMGSFIGVPTGTVRSYSHENDQLVPTDLDLIKSRRAKEVEEMAAIHQGMNPKWHTFTENVQENERKQALDSIATAERRKTEKVYDDNTDTRMSDTWVQTSLDGSKKRIKVAKHGAEIDNTDAVRSAGDVMDIDEPDAVANGPSTEHTPHIKASTSSSVAAPTGMQTCTLQEAETVNFRGIDFKVDNSIKKLIKRIGTDDILIKTSSLSFEGTDQAVAADTPDQPAGEMSEKQLSPGKPSQDTAISPISTGAVTTAPLNVDKLPPNSKKATDLASTTWDDPKATPDGALSKIAVILRFSLHSSVYATMVLRELQG